MGKSLLPAEKFVSYSYKTSSLNTGKYYDLLNQKHLSSGCLSNTIEIAWETEMSSGCSSLTFPVCCHKKAIRFQIKIIMIAFMTENTKSYMLQSEKINLFQDSLKSVSNFDYRLLWNLMTINVKHHITGNTKCS